ncbi:AAA family ATPase [Ruminococcus albus]|uniref:AAA family ATPase n=1 Tax=Ruminococcus albus TaxID=1264 RepID=UPI00048AF94A|nr:AAA family ATPase [Ruminococcus albus]
MESLLNILKKIDPSTLDYQEWINVGMALKHEGFTVADWDSWSQSDSRYHAGECEQKWQGFNGSAEPVTAGTIIQMAKDRGLTFGGDFRELDWDSEISYEEGAPTVNTGEGIPIHEPENFDPVNEIVTYLETLFEAGDNVGYVTETWESEDKGKRRYLPTKGACDRTAGELIQRLKSCGGDIGAVLGDCNPEAGAWIRFNPLDGKGVKNENVTEYRYALVESDSMPIAQQHAVIRELELPVAVLVYSGGKSLHAIVRIDAPNYDEYRKRVDYLYKVCKENGLEIDRQNRNPSRLSRLPGVVRGEHKQFIVDRNIGKSDFNEWKDYIESINDDLPDPESLSAEWDDMPELAQPLIEGVLRQGHKMLIAGPSKAGKSFALIELSIALAEGVKWLGFNCAQGRVLYVNLELDRASCLHRFKDVYTAMNLQPKNLDKLDIWNLRGRSVPMDKLAPKLIRRANKKNYIAVIIDPIYKVITGDENSADQMAKFCNQFDLICTELGTAVIYCHHHSKGSQGGKRSMDRASGSGVFARDPDALLDLTQLEITDALRKQQEDKQTCRIAENWLRRFYMENAFNQLVSQDDRVTPSRMLDIAHGALHPNSYRLMNEDIERAKATLGNRTAWRIEGTLREFASFKPLNLWFDYPVHISDTDGVLQDAAYEGEIVPYKEATRARKKKAKDDKVSALDSFEVAFSGAENDGIAAIDDIAQDCGKSPDYIKKLFGNGKKGDAEYQKRYEKFIGDDGRAYLKRRD